MQTNSSSTTTDSQHSSNVKSQLENYKYIWSTLNCDPLPVNHLTEEEQLKEYKQAYEKHCASYIYQDLIELYKEKGILNSEQKL
ncbi:hypothetical protein C9374_004499 [Naegleria lovaniensis]|uniref:Uncharacterized protein n=1 Tax=Naegleria lovaniensis TaxID=51637 RepID=A0AA88KJF5_NAELO|nr:uncharacterized protein C9374_004499 [Naegleria lovaniensis]KAG2383162.1 hypothetical protein C9374_004499 [Naegleria lovaniensis]